MLVNLGLDHIETTEKTPLVTVSGLNLPKAKQHVLNMFQKIKTTYDVRWPTFSCSTGEHFGWWMDTNLKQNKNNDVIAPLVSWTQFQNQMSSWWCGDSCCSNLWPRLTSRKQPKELTRLRIEVRRWGGSEVWGLRRRWRPRKYKRSWRSATKNQHQLSCMMRCSFIEKHSKPSSFVD